MGTTYPNRGITAKLIQRFEQSPGVVLYLDELASEMGADKHAVQQAIANLRREREDNQPSVHIKAQAWCWRPAEVFTRTAGKRVFEEIGTSKTGDIIIQDEQGSLYRATEI